MLELAKLQMAQLDLAMQKIDDLILGVTDILEAVEDENMAVKIKNTLQLTEQVTSFQFRCILLFLLMTRLLIVLFL